MLIKEGMIADVMMLKIMKFGCSTKRQSKMWFFSLRNVEFPGFSGTFGKNEYHGTKGHIGYSFVFPMFLLYKTKLIIKPANAGTSQPRPK